MSRLINADDLIAELEAACMPIYEEGLSGITGSTDTIADIINEQTAVKEKEPALSANSTSSEVASKDTDNIHLNDSTLLDICQEELKAITVIALNDYPNGYLTGYIVALKKNIERLRGGDNNG